MIKTIHEVKQYLKVDFKAGQAVSIPDTSEAAKKFILPIIGKELLESISQKYETDAPMSNAEKCLLSYVQAALVPLAYWINLAFIQFRITDNGLRKSGNDSNPGVYRWEYEKVELQLETKAADALDDLSKFLIENAADYPLWTESKEYAENRKFFIRNGVEFKGCYWVINPGLCYLYFKPIMESVQRNYVYDFIGTDFAKSLLDKEQYTEVELIAVQMIRNVVAYFTIKEACIQIGMKITDNGLTVSMSNWQYENHREKENIKLMTLSSDASKSGFVYQKKLKKFLDDNASNTVFPLYHSSEYYDLKSSYPGPSRNSNYKSFFSM